MKPVQHLISVKDGNDIEFLKEYGQIIHVAKLRNLVIIEIEPGKGILEKILAHPNVFSGREARTLHLV